MCTCAQIKGSELKKKPVPLLLTSLTARFELGPKVLVTLDILLHSFSHLLLSNFSPIWHSSFSLILHLYFTSLSPNPRSWHSELSPPTFTVSLM